MKCCICDKIVERKNSKTYRGKLYCTRHYQQMLKYGHVLDAMQVITEDLNDFEFLNEDVVKIYVYNKNCKLSGSFLIDAQDLNFVIIKKWRIWKNEVFTGKSKPILLNRYLLQNELKDSDIVQYIDSNPMNNCRSNLKIVRQ